MELIDCTPDLSNKLARLLPWLEPAITSLQKIDVPMRQKILSRVPSTYLVNYNDKTETAGDESTAREMADRALALYVIFKAEELSYRCVPSA